MGTRKNPRDLRQCDALDAPRHTTISDNALHPLPAVRHQRNSEDRKQNYPLDLRFRVELCCIRNPACSLHHLRRARAGHDQYRRRNRGRIPALGWPRADTRSAHHGGYSVRISLGLRFPCHSASCDSPLTKARLAKNGPQHQIDLRRVSVDTRFPINQSGPRFLLAKLLTFLRISATIFLHP